MSDVESKTDAQWEKLAHSWVHAFITATKTSRLYGREHPALSDALEKIIQVSTPIWESYGTVKLEIRAEVLRVLNITTNHFSKPQDNPFPLLLDHIGGLQITTGMDKSELNEFFEILYKPVKEFDENSVVPPMEANLPISKSYVFQSFLLQIRLKQMKMAKQSSIPDCRSASR